MSDYPTLYHKLVLKSKNEEDLLSKFLIILTNTKKLLFNMQAHSKKTKSNILPPEILHLRINLSCKRDPAKDEGFHLSILRWRIFNESIKGVV